MPEHTQSICNHPTKKTGAWVWGSAFFLTFAETKQKADYADNLYDKCERHADGPFHAPRDGHRQRDARLVLRRQPHADGGHHRPPRGATPGRGSRYSGHWRLLVQTGGGRCSACASACRSSAACVPTPWCLSTPSGRTWRGCVWRNTAWPSSTTFPAVKWTRRCFPPWRGWACPTS